MPLNGLVTCPERVLLSMWLSTLQQLTENRWIEVRNSHSAVVTHPTALSQTLTVSKSIRTCLFSNSQLGGNQLPAKPNYSTFATVQRLWLQFTPAVLCNLQIAFVLLSGGHLWCPAVAHRKRCLFTPIEPSDSTNYLQPLKRASLSGNAPGRAQEAPQRMRA